MKYKCNLNPKARAVYKAQQQLRPEPYFLEFFKSPALVYLPIVTTARVHVAPSRYLYIYLL